VIADLALDIWHPPTVVTRDEFEVESHPVEEPAPEGKLLSAEDASPVSAQSNLSPNAPSFEPSKQKVEKEAKSSAGAAKAEAKKDYAKAEKTWEKGKEEAKKEYDALSEKAKTAYNKMSKEVSALACLAIPAGMALPVSRY